MVLRQSIRSWTTEADSPEVAATALSAIVSFTSQHAKAEYARFDSGVDRVSNGIVVRADVQRQSLHSDTLHL